MPGDTIGQHQAKPQYAGVKGKSKYPENYFKPAFFRTQLIEDKEKYSTYGPNDGDRNHRHDPFLCSNTKENKITVARASPRSVPCLTCLSSELEVLFNRVSVSAAI